MGSERPGHRVGGGEDIKALRANGTRLATGFASVACLAGVAAVPLSRADDQLLEAGARAAVVAALLLVAALVLERPSLVPAAALLVGGLYGAQLTIDGEPLDVLAPVVAAGLLLAVELAYWSIEERVRWEGDAGDGARRAALVALADAGAFLVAALLLVLVDAVRARGLALDLVGAAAAVGVIALVVVGARQGPRDSAER